MGDVTVILDAIQRGERHAAEELIPLVYGELRGMAAAKMANERTGHTLQPTALVHEAYLRLAPQEAGWESRRHFFGAASEAMRRILVEHARHRNAAKRGGGAVHTALRTGHHEPAADEEEKLLQIHEVLDQLAEVDARQAEIVKLRYFVGLSNTEIGEVLGVDERTVRRHWELAKVWLYQAITRG